jgi:hypothetical protein
MFEKIGRPNLGHLTSREWIMRMTNKQCELQAAKQKRFTLIIPICDALTHKTDSWTGLIFVIKTGSGELIP